MAYQLTWQDDSDSPIPNMRIKVDNLTCCETTEYLIYTVQNGTLKDYRIIKYRFGGMRSFKGFAFLMSDGTIKLWRSQELLSTTVVQLAERAIEGYMNGDVCFQYAQTEMQLGFTRQCLRCNIPVIGSNWCTGHQGGTETLLQEIQNDERVTRYEQQRARRVVSSVSIDRPAPVLEEATVDTASLLNEIEDSIGLSRTVRRPGTFDPRPVSRPLRPGAPPANGLPLSENGTGIVR